MINYRKAKKEDARILIDIYNNAFYDDYIKYGECPAYGRSLREMEESIENVPKEIIVYNDMPIGVISVQNKGDNEFYLGCLGIKTSYQGRGIGTDAVKHIFEKYDNWKRFSLVTPADKKQNVKFYTEKCGFNVGKTIMDGNVEVVEFFLERDN